MNYIIYGTNRVAKDFIYIFDKLNILYLVSDGMVNTAPAQYPVYNLQYALADTSYDKIIVCDFDKTEKIHVLNDAGLQYGKDYIYEEDFFEELDEILIPSEKKVVVWGTGQIARTLDDAICGREVEFYIDSYSTEETFRDKKIVRPDEIDGWSELFVVIAVAKNKEIISQLEEKGQQKNKDFITYQKIVSLPSSMLRKTIFDRSYYDLECNTMLNHLEILHSGNTRCCCTTFVKEDLDNIFEKDVTQLWHSNLHKIMCLSTENKTFSFCDKSMCPLFVAKKKQVESVYEGVYKDMEEYPRVLALGYDSTCNLSCITCRKNLYVATGDEYEELCSISRKVNEEYMPHVKFLITAGDGEVFASKAYKEVYTSSKCNPKYMRILSNGMLFNQKNWEEFSQNKSGDIMLTVSVDAASKETYEKIRRNGNFDILKKNMEFAAALRKSGELRYFRMNFVVQRENYKEMIPFVQWGEELGVDEIFFTKILNWGTYTEAEFAEISMMEADGITPKPELKEVLAHPVMQSHIVDLGTIQYSHKIDYIDVVDNYYIWELEKRGGKL